MVKRIFQLTTNELSEIVEMAATKGVMRALRQHGRIGGSQKNLLTTTLPPKNEEYVTIKEATRICRERGHDIAWHHIQYMINRKITCIRRPLRVKVSEVIRELKAREK